MKISQIDYNQIADFLVESVELTSEDQGFDRIHILQHPDMGDVIVIANSGANAGLLIQRSAPGESIHDYLRSVATCKF